MTKKICVTAELDLNYLADCISDLDNKNIINFIKEVDGLVADYYFTKTLRDYFVKEIANEDAAREKE